MSCDALDADESVATKASGAADGDRSDALRKCITDPGGGTKDRKTLWQALRYIVLDGDELYRQTIDGLLLK
jgi:hypothetical protein